MHTKIRKEQLLKAKHPKEDSRFIIALIICIPIVILGLVLTFTLFDIILYLALSVLGAWLYVNIVKARLTGNSVKVTASNFPAIYSTYKEVKELLDYKKDVPVYIVQEGNINARISKIFRTKFILLNSGLVEGIDGEEDNIQLKWIMARFIGALKARHFRADILRIIIDSIEDIMIFNIFFFPYERAIQYTGDNIGLFICKDIEQVFTMYKKFMVGNKLSDQVEFKGILEQGKQTRNNTFFIISRSLSSYPHHIDRYLNLLAFSRKYFPTEFDSYISKFEEEIQLNINTLLPKYYE